MFKNGVFLSGKNYMLILTSEEFNFCAGFFAGCVCTAVFLVF